MSPRAHCEMYENRKNLSKAFKGPVSNYEIICKFMRMFSPSSCGFLRSEFLARKRFPSERGLGFSCMKDCPYSLAQKAPEGIIVKCFHSKL